VCVDKNVIDDLDSMQSLVPAYLLHHQMSDKQLRAAVKTKEILPFSLAVLEKIVDKDYLEVKMEPERVKAKWHRVCVDRVINKLRMGIEERIMRFLS